MLEEGGLPKLYQLRWERGLLKRQNPESQIVWERPRRQFYLAFQGSRKFSPKRLLCCLPPTPNLGCAGLSIWPHLSHAFGLTFRRRPQRARKLPAHPTLLPLQRRISRPCWQQRDVPSLPKGPTPTKPWVGVEDAPKERLLPDVPTPGAGVF